MEASGARAQVAATIRGRASPAATAAALVAVALVALLIGYGLQDVAQRTINGLVSGSYFALGAVGLTLVYGTLKLVNFAHGDMLTFGAYIAFWVSVSLAAPVLVGVLAAVAAGAALGVASDRLLWRPLRERDGGLLQMLLVAIGLAFVLRNGIQLVAGTEPRRLDVDVTSSIRILGLRVGETELLVLVSGFVVLLLVAVMLKRTTLGKQMRALSDNPDLAEVTGINTDRIVIATWVLAGGLAGLAGVLFTAAIGVITPNIGFFLLLSLFAAVILGGIGNAYGALAGGLLIGLVQEWSTLLFEARWKVAVGFVVLIVVLIVRPQGIFGREERRM